MFDLLGRRVVRTEENTIGGAFESYRLDVSRLTPGMYVVRIEGSSSVYNRLVAVAK
ncbi:MAG: T9SS type A sorting domain-containing protein [Bacteroidetes bacterium]|nr:T9SS type A sorting domain-containing protein [Bacteroidota bacterium]